MSKRDLITLMLERYGDLSETRFSGGAGEGNAPILAHARNCGVHSSSRKCSCWRLSLVELDRCLEVLRDTDRRRYVHVHGRYRLVTFSRRRFVRHRGRWEVDPNEAVVIPHFAPARPPDRVYDDVLVARWPSWVSLAEVGLGIDALDGLFRGEVWLPDGLVAA